MKVKFIWKYPIEVDIDCEKPVVVYVDGFNMSVVPEGETRIIILQEPFREHLFGLIQEYQDRYTYVLTYQEEILRTNPKARLFLGVATWIWNYESADKKFATSFVVGGKRNDALHGYSLRQRVWWARDLITTPIDFYLSSHSRWAEADYNSSSILGDSKLPLFDNQFHIAIENTSIANMFTEKLTDCLGSKTVPIYWGCTNIEKYFNMDGIIRVNNLKDIIDKCNSLTPETYATMLPAIEDNFNRVSQWCNYNEQVKLAIKQII